MISSPFYIPPWGIYIIYPKGVYVNKERRLFAIFSDRIYLSMPFILNYIDEKKKKTV